MNRRAERKISLTTSLLRKLIFIAVSVIALFSISDAVISLIDFSRKLEADKIEVLERQKQQLIEGVEQVHRYVQAEIQFHTEMINAEIRLGKKYSEEEKLVEIQSHIIKHLENNPYNMENYVFAATYSGMSLIGPSAGVNVFETEERTKAKIVRSLIEKAQAGGGLVRYQMFPEQGFYEKPVEKLSYVLPVVEWDWYIGSGVTVDRLENLIRERRSQALSLILVHVIQIILLTLITSALIILIIYIFSKHNNAQLNQLDRAFQKAALNQTVISTDEIRYVEFLKIAEAGNSLITTRKQAEESLKRSEDQNSRILGAMNEGIIFFNTKGEIIQINDKTAEVFMKKDFQTIQEIQASVNIFDENQQPLEADQTPVLKTMRTGETFTNVRLLLVSKGGTVNRWISLNCSPLGEGEPTGRYPVLATFRDITETRELEEKLHHSEKMEAIGQLAGGIAHDFNNQLAGIMGWADILDEQLQDQPELASYAQNVIHLCENAAELTGQLLAYARKGKNISRPVHINDVLHEVLNVARHSFDRQIKLKEQFTNEDFIIEGDPVLLQNAILNLAINARDALNGKGEIMLITETSLITDEALLDGDEPLPACRIIVKDNGAGIPEEIIDKIYEPFFTTKSMGAGTGLGLSAVYGTVKMHRGLIRIESREGHGTSVIIDLPMSNAVSEVTNHPQHHKKELLEGVSVMVVDDDEAINKVCSLALQKLGCEVIQAFNGRQAIEQLKKEPECCDVIILDLIMPEMSGKETFAEIHRISPGKPVIISTGYSMNEDVQMLLSNGAVGFVQKPYRKEKLAEEIRKVLD